MSRAPKRQLADRTAEADALASRWLADGHAAGALGEMAMAIACLVIIAVAAV